MNVMRAMLRPPFFLVLALGGLGNGACSSEPLSPSSAGTVDGDTHEPPPDYTTSPCYGKPGTTQVYDGRTHNVSDVPATCRAEGNRALVYVADALFDVRVTQDAVNRFLQRYEVVGSAASFRPDLGVLPTDELVFGDLSASGLADGKLPLFVIDSMGAGEGYLCSWCDGTQLHLDGTLLDSLDSEQALSIAAHESYHAIHRAYDADEAIWVDESLAEAAMTVNGYFTDQRWLRDFMRNPNQNWGPATNDIAHFHYGAGLLFGTYLWEQGGAPLMRAITREPANGFPGLDAALSTLGHDETAFQLFLDMAVALYFDDPERGYGFRSFDFDEPVARRELAPGDDDAGTIQPYGLVFEKLTPGVNTIRVTAESLIARLALDTNPVRVLPVELGVDVVVTESPALLVLTAEQESSYHLSAR
jgi:hypothetical protein